MTVTPGGEQLVIVHVKGGNDLVLSLQSPVNEDLVGEAVGILRNAFKRSHLIPLYNKTFNSFFLIPYFYLCYVVNCLSY